MDGKQQQDNGSPGSVVFNEHALNANKLNGTTAVSKKGEGWRNKRQKKGWMTIYTEACRLTWHCNQNFICAVDSQVIRVFSDHTDFIGSSRL